VPPLLQPGGTGNIKAGTALRHDPDLTGVEAAFPIARVLV